MIDKNCLPFSRLSFYLFDNVFWCPKVLILMKSNLSIFNFVTHAFGVASRNPLTNPRLWRYTPMFSTKSCVVLPLTLGLLIYFELILYMGWSGGLISFFCMWKFSCWRDYFFPIEWTWHPFCKPIGHRYMGFFLDSLIASFVYC